MIPKDDNIRTWMSAIVVEKAQYAYFISSNKRPGAC